ncbi:hypothetical protein [Gilliamella apis]|uniref:hypothetical protein n=2 Tax=Gilliamella apis TaxID=1970738 RepID=UPI000A34BFB0|nr:hypothetical protein [Gilliamella apis]OTQ37467.1 hypothetical protein B6C88_05790 [Gilliamella apis]OTQ39988.1 hypothetical protein B6D26_07415 [Gilliamella apis]OTQ42145.1 hypothetical protein B6C94_07790 [Gilliamella apis]OTQ44333.1 hypothetical protein B6C86_10900 [Gilliamella apis]OTQ62469.1 hypothetical protein B6C97_03205 [Gilliamella apis]
MVLVLTVVILQSISFSNYALTTKTTNIIYGSAPYLTFDGGRTRITNTEALLGISLSDGRRFTPTTNNSSSTNPIILPAIGQSSADIGMLVPTNTDSIALSSLIGTPYNYWGDDDGDGQGVNGVTATGSLKLSIVDRWGQAVARNEVLTNCRDQAPYKLTLSNTNGTLKTRYGVPNESRFTAGRAIYYIHPKVSPLICFAKPKADTIWINSGFSDAIWYPYSGFLPQSVTPSSYGLNFPTTGANNLYFDLSIKGVSQALSWAPVSHGGITATMTDSTSTSVRVTLTGPVATESQQRSENPVGIDRPSLPQVFELVGRDSRGNAVVKYGFELKQWFVARVYDTYTNSSVESWCNSFGYRMPKVRDLTNANCRGGCQSATPSSPDNEYRRHIGGGLFSEWGPVTYYTGTPFLTGGGYWTGEYNYMYSIFNAVYEASGAIIRASLDHNGVPKSSGVCVYP